MGPKLSLKSTAPILPTPSPILAPLPILSLGFSRGFDEIACLLACLGFIALPKLFLSPQSSKKFSNCGCLPNPPFCVLLINFSPIAPIIYLFTHFAISLFCRFLFAVAVAVAAGTFYSIHISFYYSLPNTYFFCQQDKFAP